MTIQSLRVVDFRCLQDVQIEPHPRSNLIIGPNASGKTSLLEAIYFLGRGRSFRSVRTRGLIRDGATEFALSARLDGLPRQIGVGASPDGLTIRLDGHSAKGVAHLVAALPAQVIEPGIHRLIEAGPAQRRAFLDWGVFHVKHSFLEEWRRYQRALKQRNAVLRTGGDRAAARAWEDALSASGEAVHQLRSSYMESLTGWVGDIGGRLLGHGIGIRYSRGWPDEQTLASAIDSSWERDKRMGSTQTGPHRADLQLRLAERTARSRVSRGQQKLLAAGLVLAQMHLFNAERQDSAVLLLDDPAAELDRHSLERLFGVIADVPAQRFITGLDEAQMPAQQDFGMFHVEQGKIQKMV